MCALVDKAIELCRAEERKLSENIRQYKDILRSMKMRVNDCSEAETPTSVKDNEISLKERQEVELLEQALKKAWKIRSSFAVEAISHEKPCSSGSTCKASAVKGDKRNPQKSSLPSEVKGSRQCAGLLKSTTGRGDVATRQVLDKMVPSAQHAIRRKQSDMKRFSTKKSPGVDVEIKPCHMTSYSPESDRRMMTPHLDQELIMQSEASAPKEHWVPSPSLPQWQAEQAKKNKLWNKVLTRHSKPVPERDHFKKRLINTFPPEWASVHIAAMEAELDGLTQLGLDLTHCYTAQLQSHQLGWSPEPSTEKEYESLLMLAGLEKMMVQVMKEADCLKKDWERKMAWWHGALCPLRSKFEWCNSEHPCIPPVLAYGSEGELEDLYNLRRHVAQLKLEIRMHQAMCDALLDLPSFESSSGRPSAHVLRGVYSLLGEGGTQFPSLVLDIDSAQT